MDWQKTSLRTLHELSRTTKLTVLFCQAIWGTKTWLQVPAWYGRSAGTSVSSFCTLAWISPTSGIQPLTRSRTKYPSSSLPWGLVKNKVAPVGAGKPVKEGAGMIVGGCDVGSATGKAVIMKDREVIAWEIIPSTTKPEVTARTVMDKALAKAGLSSIKD